MMKKMLFSMACSLLFLSGLNIYAQDIDNKITLDLTDGQKIFTREIGKNLLLRVVKDSSVRHKNFGWIIEVAEKPYKRGSENLIYQNLTGNTADQSQVYAWHVASGEFPNVRKLKVKGFRQKIKIALQNPKVKGIGPNARFVSGKMQISWSDAN